MNISKILFLVILILVISACNSNKEYNTIEGTWRLVSATASQKDSTFSTFDSNTKMIKIINATHFAFFNHDLNNGKDSATATFSGGGGTYTLKDSVYKENLDYFNNRQWENNSFEFIVKIKNDTLIQKGVEKIEKLGVDRIIIEKYVREK